MGQEINHGGMAQSVEHIVHIDGVVGSSPTVTTENQDHRNGDPDFSYSDYIHSFIITMKSSYDIYGTCLIQCGLTILLMDLFLRAC